MNPDDIHLSYLPMAHVFEKLNMAGILTYGGRIGFYCGDILKIRDDLSDLKVKYRRNSKNKYIN